MTTHRGTHFNHAWVWKDDSWIPSGTKRVGLRLRRDGTFVFREYTDGRKKPWVQRGRYHLRAQGRLVLKGRFGRRTQTFMPCRSEDRSHPAPRRCVAMSWPYPRGGWGATVFVSRS